MFNNLRELILTMPDENACREYVAQQRWNGKPICPHCGHDRVYIIEGGKKYKCASKACYKKFSVTVGTVFECSNIPLTKWLTALYLATAHKKGISSYQLAKDIGVAQKTAWFMLHRLREIMKSKEVVKLNGMVEVDEVYIGGRMKNKHKSVRANHKDYNATHAGNKTGVMGLIERGKDLKVEVINFQQKTLKEMVRENVNNNATIITDSLFAYRGLNKEYAAHEVISHDKDEFVRGVYHTNTIEGFFSYLKRSIFGIYHQVSPKHLQRYCTENGYRYNTRGLTDPQRFNLSVGNLEGRLDYKTLIGKK